MNIKAAGCEGRVMLCRPTACPKMCLDATRPVITRYGDLLPHSPCEIACSYRTLCLISVFTKSLESSTHSLALFLFLSVFVSSCNLVVNSPAVLPVPRLLCNPNSITMFTRARTLSWSRFCRFTPSHLICCNICFNKSFPWALVYFTRYLFFLKKKSFMYLCCHVCCMS